MHVYDDKWPTLVVEGAPVAPELAEQILIRCDGLDLATFGIHGEYSNEHAWTEAAHRILTGTTYPWTPETPEERVRAVLAQAEARSQRGLLQLHYLATNRIAAPAKGMRGSWIDWDGTLGARAYTIGKWPGCQEVTEDWGLIAAAFPDLTLRAQLVSHDAQTPARGVKVWGTWSVADGAAEFDQDATEPLWVPQAPYVWGAEPLDLDLLRQITTRVLGPQHTTAAPQGRA